MLFLLIIILILIYLYNQQVIENLYTFNGRMSIDDQYFYDKLFNNVTYYPNKYIDNYELGPLTETGINKCLSDCNIMKDCNCVEYGITGNAYAFKNL